MTSPQFSAEPACRIGILIFDGVTNLDFAGPFEVLARMPDTKVYVLGKTLDSVKSDVGAILTPTTTLRDCPPLNVIVVVGGPGVDALVRDQEVLDFLRTQAATADWVTSVCTGALVLGAAGLLNGYRVTTHWTAMEALRWYGAKPVHERVVIDRNRATGGGVTAGIDFGLALVALLQGDTAAQIIELGIEYSPQPPFNAGSPDTAPAAVVQAVREHTAAMTASRLDDARRIGQSLNLGTESS